MSEQQSRRVRLGIIGLGVMGSKTLRVALDHPDYDVALAADADQGAVERARAAFPGVTYGTPEEVVAAEGLDAVYIATPPASHAVLTLAAFASGKAVFCEKPLSVTDEDGRRMVEAAEATGLANAVNFPLADVPATPYVEDALRSGEIGEILGVDVRLTFPEWPRPWQAAAAWVGERAEGGFTREVFSHFAYLTDRIAGPLRAAHAGITPNPDPGLSEIGAHGLLFAGETPVHVSGRAGVAGAEAYEWVLWGSRRSFLLRDWSKLHTSDGGPWEPVDLPRRAGGDGSRLTSFARAVRGEPFTDLADFAAALRVRTAVEAFHGEKPAA